MGFCAFEGLFFCAFEFFFAFASKFGLGFSSPSLPFGLSLSFYFIFIYFHNIIFPFFVPSSVPPTDIRPFPSNLLFRLPCSVEPSRPPIPFYFYLLLNIYFYFWYICNRTIFCRSRCRARLRTAKRPSRLARQSMAASSLSPPRPTIAANRSIRRRSFLAVKRNPSRPLTPSSRRARRKTRSPCRVPLLKIFFFLLLRFLLFCFGPVFIWK